MMKQLGIIVLALCLVLTGCKKEERKEPTVIGSNAESSSQGRFVEGEQTSLNPHAGVSLPPIDGDVVEIKEKLFIAQTNDMYLNAQDYLGKTIRYEGMYKNSEEWEDDREEILHFVIRYGPGCCGYDGEAGFEVRWDGEWPQVDDWVEVTGVLQEEVYPSGYKVLYLQVASFTVKQERGAEFVSA